MNKNFGTIKTNVGNMVGDTSSTFATKIGVWINNKYEDFMNSYNWDELFYTQIFSATASTSAVALRNNVEKIMFLYDSTNGGYLAELSEEDFYAYYYDDITDTGTPDKYFYRYEPVRNQPSSATAPTVKSSSASDTTQTILLRGISSDVEMYESISLNGTTAATAANSYSQILSIAKSAITTGKITMYENNGTTVLSEIPPEQLESRYLQLHLHPIPTSENVYHVREKIRVQPLSQSTDVPIIDCATILEIGAQADAWKAKRQFAKGFQLQQEYEILKQKAIFERTNKPNYYNQFVPLPLDRNEGIL